LNISKTREGFTRMSKELNKARRNVEDKLSILISKLEFSDSITYELKQKLS
jgi:hypothetical protein